MNAAVRTTAGAALLLAVLAAGVAWALAQDGGDPARRRAIALAAAVTGAGAILGWLTGRIRPKKGPFGSVAAPLAAMVVRLVPGLVALGWVTTSGGDLRQAGAAGLLVEFHLAMLVCSTTLEAIDRRKGPPISGGDGAN